MIIKRFSPLVSGLLAFFVLFACGYLVEVANPLLWLVISAGFGVMMAMGSARYRASRDAFSRRVVIGSMVLLWLIVEVFFLLAWPALATETTSQVLSALFPFFFLALFSTFMLVRTTRAEEPPSDD